MTKAVVVSGVELKMTSDVAVLVISGESGCSSEIYLYKIPEWIASKWY